MISVIQDVFAFWKKMHCTTRLSCRGGIYMNIPWHLRYSEDPSKWLVLSCESGLYWWGVYNEGLGQWEFHTCENGTPRERRRGSAGANTGANTGARDIVQLCTTYCWTYVYMQPMVLEYESQHLPLSKITQSDVGFYIPAPWVAYGIPSGKLT